MERSPFFRPVLMGHAISTLVQSITWFILSIICFLYYSDAFVVKTVESTYRSALETWIYRLYLRKDNADDNINYKLLNITPESFITFCALYFILSIIIINASIVVIYIVQKMKEKPLNFCQNCTIMIWIFTGLVQSLFDLIFFSLLLDDYNFFANQNYTSPHMGMVPTAIGVVMTIVARGFVLWIINLAFDATSMLMIIRQYQKERQYEKDMLPPPMERRSTLRRSTMRSDRPYTTDLVQIGTGQSNGSFVSDRYDQYPGQIPQAVYRQPPPIVARFNPPPPPPGAVVRRSSTYDDRFEDQNRPVGGLRRSGSNLYSGR